MTENKSFYGYIYAYITLNPVLLYFYRAIYDKDLFPVPEKFVFHLR